MKGTIDLFVRLGMRLKEFGKDARSQAVLAEACRANSWFSRTEVQRAVSALVESMLQRERLEPWLEHYPVPVSRPQRVLVVMAGNIPLVGFFDLLCVLASGHRCLVKPSSKDTALMTYIMELLRELDSQVPLALYDGQQTVDAVIATGSDQAKRYFQNCYAGIPALLRGSRQSVAVLSGKETGAQLAGLADDIWAYSGLGCRNVSLVFLPEGCPLQLCMPRTKSKIRNSYLQTRALLTMTGQPFVDLGGSVAVEQRAFPSALSRINCSFYRDVSEVESWLAEHDEELQCVVSECIEHSRRVDFGYAQSPALTDYPDGRDVLQFLTTLN